jgi:hypothetical protein
MKRHLPVALAVAGLRGRCGRRPRPLRRGRALAEDSHRRPRLGRSGASAPVTLPALEIAPPFFFWGRKEVAIDVLHHTVYTAATGLAYAWLDERD